MHSYKELIVWQKSIALVKEIYKLTVLFPKNEQFVIISQIHRAAISIPSNIAEGYARRSHKEYLQFYSIAYGSALELDTQLIISKELKLAPAGSFRKSEELLVEVIKMLYVMVYREKGGVIKRLVNSV
ncbi:four helix bundle protein [Candidatus Daviesbacteria bacterium]|nr:four helix bundle protein [Candidatus Daviesbacteria bacterium]